MHVHRCPCELPRRVGVGHAVEAGVGRQRHPSVHGHRLVVRIAGDETDRALFQHDPATRQRPVVIAV